MVPDSAVTWQVTRLEDGALVQSGAVVPDSLGLLTVRGVKVYRGGSRLDLGLPTPPVLGVPEARPPSRPLIRLARNPATAATPVTVAWPGTGAARLELFDAAGRRVRVLFQGAAAMHVTTAPLGAAGSPAGLYFLVARQGGLRTVQRVVLLK